MEIERRGKSNGATPMSGQRIGQGRVVILQE